MSKISTRLDYWASFGSQHSPYVEKESGVAQSCTKPKNAAEQASVSVAASNG